MTKEKQHERNAERMEDDVSWSLNVMDLIIAVLQQHERSLDASIARLENALKRMEREKSMISPGERRRNAVPSFPQKNRAGNPQPEPRGTDRGRDSRDARHKPPSRRGNNRRPDHKRYPSLEEI